MSVTYRCEDCGEEWEVDGPPIKSRTCFECGGRVTPERQDTGKEWVLVLAQWPDDEGGFPRPALERFDADRLDKAREVHAEYAENDANHMNDYKLVRRENVDSLPFDVSFDNCNDRFVDTGIDR